jgi:hypothetical protein
MIRGRRGQDLAHCGTCGAEREPGAAFCSQCGAAHPEAAPPPPAATPPEAPQRLFAGKKGRRIAAVCAAAAVGCAVAAALLVPHLFGDGPQDRNAIRAIEQFSGERSATKMQGRQAYIGGELLRFTRASATGPIGYFVDSKTNRVMRMDAFGIRSYRRVIDKAAAQAKAEAFAKAHFEGFERAGLHLTESRLVDHGDNSGTYYSFTWMKRDRDSGAVLPVAVSVRIDAAKGRVFSYDSVDAKVTIGTTPTIDSGVAERATLKAIGTSVPSARVTRATLAVSTDPPDDPKGRQALVWQVVVEGSSDPGYSTGAFVYVDARSGKVLKIDPYQ